MNNDIIEHSGQRYEIVTCRSDTCSFRCPACALPLKGCNAPSWWRHIHSNRLLGLRLLAPVCTPVSKPKLSVKLGMQRPVLKRIYRPSKLHALHKCDSFCNDN